MIGVDFLIILLLVATIWYWQDGMQAKELARNAGRKACENAGVIFLDDTVALKIVRLRRNRHGRTAFFRRYYFEFASDGEWRYRGCIALLGREVLDVDMEAHRQA